MVYQIIPQELNEMLNNDDAVIIDVREPFEYEYGHIKNSILIPVFDIFNNPDLLKKYENKK